MHRKYSKKKVILFSFLVCYHRAMIQSDESNNILIRLIVRINGKKLHIRDPHFYKNIYARSGQRVDKDFGAVAAYTVLKQALLLLTMICIA